MPTTVTRYQYMLAIGLIEEAHGSHLLKYNFRTRNNRKVVNKNSSHASAGEFGYLTI